MKVCKIRKSKKLKIDCHKIERAKSKRGDKRSSLKKEKM